MDSKDVVERYAAAAEAADEATLREILAEDAAWRLYGELPTSGTWRGREVIIGQSLAGYYEPGSVRLEVTSMIAEGDRVAMEWTSRARTRSGDPHENRCIGVFTVCDGKIAVVREYTVAVTPDHGEFSR